MDSRTQEMMDLVKKQQQVRAFKIVLGLIVAILGYGILIAIDWRIALGIFLAIFSNNLAGSNK